MNNSCLSLLKSLTIYWLSIHFHLRLSGEIHSLEIHLLKVFQQVSGNFLGFLKILNCFYFIHLLCERCFSSTQFCADGTFFTSALKTCPLSLVSLLIPRNLMMPHFLCSIHLLSLDSFKVSLFLEYYSMLLGVDFFLFILVGIHCAFCIDL